MAPQTGEAAANRVRVVIRMQTDTVISASSASVIPIAVQRQSVPVSTHAKVY
jgi:hypothetical protein